MSVEARFSLMRHRSLITFGVIGVLASIVAVVPAVTYALSRNWAFSELKNANPAEAVSQR